MPFVLVMVKEAQTRLKARQVQRISLVQAMVPRGYRVGQTAELIRALSNEQL